MRGCTVSDQTDTSFKVCKAKGEKLVILQSLARKWLEFEGTKDAAREILAKHNSTFNNECADDYLEDDERQETNKTFLGVKRC